MLKKNDLTPTEQATIVADSDKAFDAEEAKPTWNEVLEEFPTLQTHLKDNDDGSRTLDYLADCDTPEQRTRRMYDVESMFSTFHRKDCDLGQEKQGRIRKVRLREPNGRIREVAEEFEDHMSRKLGARRLRVPRYPGRNVWRRADGTTWVQRPGGEWKQVN
jgi:hypothetical protein